MFQQHKFAAQFIGVPTIQITEDVLRDMWHVVDIVQMEVGWFCTVKNLGDNKYLLDGMYLPTQECHGATTEITAGGEAKMMNDLISQEAAAGIQPTDPLHKLNRLDAWFHSHVDMETTPSGQDLSEMEKFRATGRPYFIRGIVNKRGKISIAYYDSRSSLTGFRVEDCPWEVIASTAVDPQRERWRAEVAGKVSRLGQVAPRQQPPTNGYAGGYTDYGYVTPDWRDNVVPGRRSVPQQPVNTVPRKRSGLW